MALTASAQFDKVRPISKQSFPVANGETIYLGAYVKTNAAGFLVNADGTTGGENAGFAISVDETVASATSVTGTASNTPSMGVDIGGRIIENQAVTGASAQSDVNSLVYATDENTWTTTDSGAQQEVGMIVAFNTATSFDVLFFPMHTMRMVR
jgi:hypothetical protein